MPGFVRALSVPQKDRTIALHAALRFVVTSDILAQHKATLIEVLTQALRDDAAAELRQQAAAQTRGEWQEQEIVQLKSFLQDRIARSWQQADECVMQLAAQLRRDPRSIRDKAVELGLSASV
ncbi:MAG: hypothetical protein ACREUC_15880, partial [Steroidobacteraceae bacterium]